MTDAEFYQRFEIADDTVDEADPRWRVWDKIERCYLPGYWSSTDAAREGAKHIAEQEQKQN